jgi:proteasome lid subunit RPN8/RPN11
VFAIFKELWSTERLSVNEDCNVLFLNQNNRVVSYYQHSKGGINQTTIDIEMVCALAIKCLAKGVIVAHNHPSENLRPSEADSNFTRKLKTALALFSVNLLDSLIITKDSYFSFADDGLMEKGGTLKIAEKKYLKDKVKKVISEFNLGKLKTSAGKKVTDVKQALAIGYSEAKAGWKHKKQKRK